MYCYIHQIHSIHAFFFFYEGNHTAQITVLDVFKLSIVLRDEQVDRLRAPVADEYTSNKL